MNIDIKERIRQLVCTFVESYAREHGCQKIWREPIVGFADANCAYIKNIEKAVGTEHKQPSDFLKDASIVISCFVPFTKEVSATNTANKESCTSKEWSDAYEVTNDMLGELAAFIVDELRNLGYEATVPVGIGMKEEELKSSWSHRHIAYAAGMGTFGINNMLITEKGCCGRYCSIITKLPVEADRSLESENCLYKKNGSCAKCVEHCVQGALTAEGFDRFKCFEVCLRNEKLYGHEVCGKCTTEIPCAFTVPQAI